MLKRYFQLLLLLVMTVASSQAGTWRIHNYYVSSKIQNVYDTGDKVYYVNSGDLFQFDKATSTTISFNSLNKLSDVNITQAYYDWENKLLFLAYFDNNIDIIDASGKVYNVSNVKNAVFNVRNYTLNENVLAGYTGNTINDITFAHGIAYVTLDYGYVTIDETTKRVVDHVNLGAFVSTTNINSVAVIGNTMLILTDKNCYYGPLGTTGNPFAAYNRQSGTFSGAKLYPINETSAFLMGSTSLYRYDFSGSAPVLTRLLKLAPVTVQKAKDGFIANFPGQDFYYTIDATGMTVTQASTTAGFATSDPMGDGKVWINDAKGLHLKGSSVNYMPNALTTDEPYWLKYSAAMDKLYAGTSALNGQNRSLPSNMAPHVINTFDGQQWKAETPYSSSGAAYEFVFDPLDPHTYVRASWESGLHKVTNDELVITYNKSNSIIGKRKPHPAFDKNGNLWVVCSYNNPTCPVAVLPRAKYLKSSVKLTDWFQPSGLLWLNTGEMQRSRFIISKKNNVKIYNDCDYQSSAVLGHFVCWDNASDDPTVDNYKAVCIVNFVDQNNKQIDWTYIMHVEEDNDGMIWAGYTSGLFVFDPDVVFDDYPHATRPYVTKSSEGKGYLCEGLTVHDIGVTRDNKKWIATDNGVYYVSPDGTEVYDHFTTQNSNLPGNLVYSIECDTVHDRVYAFTDGGFAEYDPQGEVTMVNFDDAYVFPNPVEPDFTGLVKIANLMKDSYVTITDRAGQVVAQMGPVQGSALWNGCGADGDRVATGVYNIYVAQGGQPSTVGAPRLTILVIK